MSSLKSLCLWAAVLTASVTAKTVKITATDDNTFDPDSVEADEGDTIEFHFDAKNSSVVAGDYRYPCSPLDLGDVGFFSGFVPADDDKVFQVTLNSSDPIPFYSSQDDQCAQGMVGIINPSANKTLDDYKEAASELSKGVTPGRSSFGGELVDSEDAGKSDDDDDDDGGDNAAGTMHVSTFGLLCAVGLAMVLV